VYYDYPTGTDARPSNDVIDPAPGNNANFWDNGPAIGGLYRTTEVGEFENSESPYGTFDQGGNVWEWNEAIYGGLHRVLRGGGYDLTYTSLRAVSRNNGNPPTAEYYTIGFRLASVPEPGSTALLICGALGMFVFARRRRRQAAAILIAGMIVFVGAGRASAEPVELIVNGRFEGPSISPQRWDTFEAISEPTGIEGWTISSGSVDLVAPSCGCGLPYEGQQWLDLTGRDPGAIEQSFATNVGQTYELSFWYANNTAGSAPAYVADVTVTGDSTLLDTQISHSGSGHNNMNYELFSDAFVADSSSTTLRFQSLTTSGSAGIALDYVSVVIPEPGTIALLLCGAFTLLGFAWRRRKNA